MLSFLATIVCTVLIFLLFSSFKRWGIQTDSAITLNYFVAAGLGWSLAGGADAVQACIQASWILPLSAIGIFFYPLFRLTATCSQELGISVATIATKLSMAIPVLVLALADGIHHIHWGQWLGISLAFPAVYLSSRSSKFTPSSATSIRSLWWIPFVMFAGSGCIDLVFGWFSTDPNLAVPGMQMAFASVPFTLGGLVGLLHQVQVGFKRPSIRDILGGLLLGVANFGSLYFLLIAFKVQMMERAMVIPLLNLSVIVLATLAGAIILHDRPNKQALWGVALATTAIGLMMIFG